MPTRRTAGPSDENKCRTSSPVALQGEGESLIAMRRRVGAQQIECLRRKSQMFEGDSAIWPAYRCSAWPTFQPWPPQPRNLRKEIKMLRNVFWRGDAKGRAPRTPRPLPIQIQSITATTPSPLPTQIPSITESNITHPPGPETPLPPYLGKDLPPTPLDVHRPLTPEVNKPLPPDPPKGILKPSTPFVPPPRQSPESPPPRPANPEPLVEAFPPSNSYPPRQQPPRPANPEPGQRPADGE